MAGTALNARLGFEFNVFSFLTFRYVGFESTYSLPFGRQFSNKRNEQFKPQQPVKLKFPVSGIRNLPCKENVYYL
jgi:hypothetical protein